MLSVGRGLSTRGRSAFFVSSFVQSTNSSQNFSMTQERYLHVPRWLKNKNARKGPRETPAPEIPTFTEEKELNPFVRRTHPTFSTKRAGVLATKVGCMSLWDEWGERHFVTVCKVDKNTIMQQRTIQKDGYTAVQIGAGTKATTRVTKNMMGEFIKMNVPPKAYISEIKCSPDALLPAGHEMSVRHFTPGQWVFVSGFSQGKGFKSAIQRWGFGGSFATHGRTGEERRVGAVGQGQTVHTIWKFKKMGGHMGPDPRVVNAKVFRYETERGLLFLRGQVPGAKGAFIKVSDARGVTSLLNRDFEIPFPTFIPEAGKQYPVTVQCPPKLRDPFLFPDVAIDED